MELKKENTDSVRTTFDPSNAIRDKRMVSTDIRDMGRKFEEVGCGLWRAGSVLTMLFQDGRRTEERKRKTDRERRVLGVIFSREKS